MEVRNPIYLTLLLLKLDSKLPGRFSFLRLRCFSLTPKSQHILWCQESQWTGFNSFFVITMRINPAHEKNHICKKKKNNPVSLEILRDKLSEISSPKYMLLNSSQLAENSFSIRCWGSHKQINSHTSHKYSQLEIPSVLVKSFATLYKCSRFFEKSVRNCSNTADIPHAK